MSDQFIDSEFGGDTPTIALAIHEILLNETNRADEHATLLAAAWFFEDLCEQFGADPIDALAQLIDHERPIWEPEDEGDHDERDLMSDDVLDGLIGPAGIVR